ncbi:MAG: YtxH domain-containing protein [Chlamydiota bacterium]|jgi:gas vesicle protein
MFKHHHHNHHGEFFIGALVGSCVGVMTTLLFSTKKGKKIQKDVVHKCKDLTEDAEDFIKSFAHKKGKSKKK